MYFSYFQDSEKYKDIHLRWKWKFPGGTWPDFRLGRSIEAWKTYPCLIPIFPNVYPALYQFSENSFPTLYQFLKKYIPDLIAMCLKFIPDLIPIFRKRCVDTVPCPKSLKSMHFSMARPGTQNMYGTPGGGILMSKKWWKDKPSRLMTTSLFLASSLWLDDGASVNRTS